MKFPVDIPKEKVLRILSLIGFKIIREGNHISMLRKNPDGTDTPLTLPNHRRIKGSTLRRIMTQSGISREEFMGVLENLK